jgi:dethiobiotin synthetase
LNKIKLPNTKNNIVVEGAGGVLVPLNDKDLIIDIIKPDYKVIIVSQNYLGSINHTLLTIEALKCRGLNIVGVIFNGNENNETQSIINQIGNIPVIGRVNKEPIISKEVIKKYAAIFNNQLNKI